MLTINNVGGFLPKHTAEKVSVITDIPAIDDFLTELRHVDDKEAFMEKHGYTLLQIDDEFFSSCCSLSEVELVYFDDFMNQLTFPLDFEWIDNVQYKNQNISGYLIMPLNTHPDTQ